MARSPQRIERIGPFVREAGTARRYVAQADYVLPSGRVVQAGDTLSRRQAENIRARAAGFESWSQLQGTRESRTEAVRAGWHSRSDFLRAMNTPSAVLWQQQAVATGNATPADFANPKSGWARSYLKARNDNWRETRRGAFAKFLVQTGYRTSRDPWPPGQTPGRQR